MDATGLGEPQSFERVLSSMCTEPHPLARRAAERFLATNPGDPETYRTVAELETEVVERLGDLVGLDSPAGYVATGGTEANLQAVRAARNLAATDSPNVVAPASAHFSFSKAADVLGVELRLVDLGEDFRADPDAMRAAADGDTVLVVGVAGTTEYGRVDPIPELGAIAADAGARFHVDAAWGGFLLPFADRAWNFDDAPVDTMTVDPHKHGMAAIPSGGFLAREERTLDALTVGTPYLESGTQASLTGTRSGAGVASAAAVLRELWPEGYRAEYERATALAAWFASELDARGYDVVPPALPLVSADVSERVFEALRESGWRVSRTAAGELRVVCMPHVDREMLRTFLDDLDDAESKA